MIINIVWEGPLTLKRVEECNDRSRDVGIYQIYGPHYAYGINALLYIGKAEGQTFSQRICQHNWHLYERGSEISVHIGRLVRISEANTEGSDNMIGIAEKLLIYVHGPGYNASNIKDPRPTPELCDLRILNWKNHGILLPEVSGARWLLKAPGDPSETGVG